MEQEFNCLDKNYSETNYETNLVAMTHVKKKRKLNRLSCVTLGYMHSRKGSRKTKHVKRLRILFDTGCENTIINSDVVSQLEKRTGSKSRWKTKSGSFSTNKTCKVVFTLPAFHKHKEINWTAHVDESDQSDSRYDLIIGRDLMKTVGIDIINSRCSMTWDNKEIPMQEPEWLDEDNLDRFEDEIFMTEEPADIGAEQIQEILDAKYAPADLPAEIEKLTH